MLLTQNLDEATAGLQPVACLKAAASCMLKIAHQCCLPVHSKVSTVFLRGAFQVRVRSPYDLRSYSWSEKIESLGYLTFP